jgi:transcription elongation factor GreA
MSEQSNLTLAEAATQFIATLSPGERQECQQELNKFVRWYGSERPIAGISAREIGGYGDNISAHVTDPVKKLEPVRKFLSFAKKKKWVAVSLAPHLRISKVNQRKPARRVIQEVAPADLTAEGYSSLEAELEGLKKERVVIADRIGHAAADKDFRENAPLEAAREHQGQVESRIRDLEAILKTSTIMDNKPRTSHTVGVGCTVEISEIGSGEQGRYLMVSPSESNPAGGKLSIASPIGKALLHQEVGTVVEVDAPAGIVRYRIESIKG